MHLILFPKEGDPKEPRVLVTPKKLLMFEIADECSLAVHVRYHGYSSDDVLSETYSIGVLLQQTEFGIVMLFYARIPGKE